MQRGTLYGYIYDEPQPRVFRDVVVRSNFGKDFNRLKIDITAGPGFPNGRTLPDPVIDVTLALLLLDVAGGSHTPFDLIGALNPPANDVPFMSLFPWVAAPSQ